MARTQSRYRHKRAHSVSAIYTFRTGETDEQQQQASGGLRIDSHSDAPGLPQDQNNYFNMRGFVSLVRKQAITKTWPFSETLLQLYVGKGLTLPHIAEEQVEVASAAAGSEQEQEQELQFDLEEGATASDARGAGGLMEEAGLEDSEAKIHEEEQEKQQHRDIDVKQVHDPAIVSDWCGQQTQNSRSALELLGEVLAADHAAEDKEKGAIGCIEDKASDTGADQQEIAPEPVTAASDGSIPRVIGNGVIKLEDQQQRQQQQQQIGSSSFSCQSVTALNAHTDVGCLSGDKNRKNLRSKVQKKMRSMTEIIAANPSPAPKQSDSQKQAERVGRERRAPNHVVVLADKEDAIKSQTGGHQQRHLRPRARSSQAESAEATAAVAAVASVTAAEERLNRRRRRNVALKSVDLWADSKKKRQCSGNAVEDTSSRASSESHCGWKIQDSHVEKLSTAEDKSQIQDKKCAQEAEEVQSSKENENGDRLTSTGVVQDASLNKPDGSEEILLTKDDVEAPPKTEEIEAASKEDDQAKMQIDENHDRVEGDPEKPSPMETVETTNKVVEVIPVDQEATLPSPTANSTVTVSDQSSPSVVNPEECTADPDQQATPSVVNAEVITPATPNIISLPIASQVLQRPRQAIPLYESMISSLRSCTAVDSLTGHNNFRPTWKAAVVMATLGASLRQVSGNSRTGTASTTAAAGSRDEELLSRRTSESICIIPAVPAVEKSSNIEKAAASGYQQHLSPPQAGNRTSSSSTADRSRVPFPNSIPESLQVVPTKLPQTLPKVPRWISSGDRRTVIDVEDTTKAQGGDKPVIRLLGQNVTVESAAHRDVQGARNPYGFPVPSLHSAGPGYHSSCCCSNPYASCNNGSIPQIGLPGATWRLVPNGIINQVTGQTVNLQGGPTKNTNCYAVTQQQLRPSAEKHPGDLPPWLLEAKKQKEAEVAANNIIVIDDDEPEEQKVNPESASTSRAGEIQFGSRASASQKREASVSNQQAAEKSAKVSATDSPGSSRNMGIPVLVPTWMITSNSNNSNLSNNSSPPNNASKRGATAQTYKARIAMMKAGGVINRSSGLPPGSLIYEVPTEQRIFQIQGGDQSSATPAMNFAHPGFITGQQPFVQQPLVLGKDCHIIELEDGQCLIVNGPMMEATTSGASPSEISATENSHLGAATGGVSGRNFIICNNNSVNNNNDINSDSRRTGGNQTGEPILVTPVLQQGNGGIVLAASTDHLMINHHHHHHAQQQQQAQQAVMTPVIPLSILQQQQQIQLQQQQQQIQLQQLSMLQSHQMRGDKGGVVWGYGQKRQ